MSYNVNMSAKLRLLFSCICISFFIYGLYLIYPVLQLKGCIGLWMILSANNVSQAMRSRE